MGIVPAMEFSKESMIDKSFNSWEDSAKHNFRFEVACFKFASLAMHGSVINEL